MGLDGFERSASGIFLEFVIPADAPDFTFVFQSHLAGAKDVACWMKRNIYTMDVTFFLVGNAFNGFVFTQTNFKQCLTWGGAQVMSGSSACVVSMRVGDHCPVDALGRIDKKISDLTIESLGLSPNQHKGCFTTPIRALSVQHYGGIIRIVNDPLGCGSSS